MPVIFDTVNCIVCRACIIHCPEGAITFSNNILRRNSQLCAECGRCVDVCTTRSGSKYADAPKIDDTVETDLITCDRCGRDIGTTRHLRWLIERLCDRLPENLYAIHLRLEELPESSKILCTRCRQSL